MNVALLLLATIPGADTIDSILEREWQDRGMQPAEVCSDDQFLRRVSLDLIGRIPTVEEVHRFRSNLDRSATIDTLLASDEFPRFWSDCHMLPCWNSQQ